MLTQEELEGSKCPLNCGGNLIYPQATECTCHINPPCSQCTDVRLTCNICGYEIEPQEQKPDYFIFNQPARAIRKSHKFEKGEITDWEYDSSSGSTMVYKGRYKGEVTSIDIISYFGDGTFGHRGPVFKNGIFIYTKITD